MILSLRVLIKPFCLRWLITIKNYLNNAWHLKIFYKMIERLFFDLSFHFCNPYFLTPPYSRSSKKCPLATAL